MRIGYPVAVAPETARPTAREIYERVIQDARDELARPASRLGFSALLAGATVGLSGLAAAIALSVLGGTPGATFAAAVVYPIGFLAAILGRSQLFTENTLYPVALVLAERRHLVPTARLWAVVFVANTVGAFLLALLVTQTGAVGPGAVHELVKLGDEIHAGGFAGNFWSAVVSGWLLALVAWLVEAAEAAVGQFLVIAALTFLVGVGQFDHSVASTSEVFAAMLDGTVGVASAAGWLGTAVLGNVVGGGGIVALLNYGQVRD
jgi:formate/nitrite transporter FocA (FNT family)